MKNLLAFLVAAVFLAGNALSADLVTAKIINIEVHGDDSILIHLDRFINEGGCRTDNLEIMPNYPAAKATLAIATLAFATEKRIQVVTDACINGNPTLSGRRFPYFKILNEKL